MRRGETPALGVCSGLVFSCAIAGAMGQSETDIERLRIGALLHDIGKIGISDFLLQKPGRLSEEEFKLIKRHPVRQRFYALCGAHANRAKCGSCGNV